MKRIFILITGMLLLGAVAWAEESVMIDFGQLVPDSDEFPGQHEQTIIDYSDVPIASLPEEDREQMRTSLAIENWEVELASSSATVGNRTSSFVRMAEVSENSDRFAGEAAMGVRVRFPESRYNSWALVQPPFEIPAYDADRSFDGFGVVRNVGAIRQVRASVYGMNFPHRLSIILMDESNQRQEIMLGHLEFAGWHELVWENPNYVEDVRDREVSVMPRYPQSDPIQKLDGMRVFRDQDHIGGDFVTYFKDVTIVYDQAMLEDEPDIEHEEIWGILEEREQRRRQNELQRLGREQTLRYLEDQLMDDTADNGANGQNGNGNNNGGNGEG